MSAMDTFAPVTRFTDYRADAPEGCAPCQQRAAAAAATTYDAEGRALSATPPTPVALEEYLVAWEGVIGIEGELTGDGRLIEFDALRWDGGPIGPLRYAPTDQGAHGGAVDVGRIDNIERRDGGIIWGRGVIDLRTEMGAAAVRGIETGISCGVSMDLDDVSFEVRVLTEALEKMRATMPEPGAEVIQAEVRAEDGTHTVMETHPSDEVVDVTTSGRIRGVTIVSIPAFASARIGLTEFEDEEEEDEEELDEEDFSALVANLRLSMRGETTEYRALMQEVISSLLQEAYDLGALEDHEAAVFAFEPMHAPKGTAIGGQFISPGASSTAEDDQEAEDLSGESLKNLTKALSILEGLLGEDSGMDSEARADLTRLTGTLKSAVGKNKAAAAAAKAKKGKSGGAKKGKKGGTGEKKDEKKDEKKSTPKKGKKPRTDSKIKKIADDLDKAADMYVKKGWITPKKAEELRAAAKKLRNDKALTASAFNWVEDAGGLPEYIERISKHLIQKGMDKSHAIATAVNVCKKMCSSGDVNFPGVQQVNEESRAEACAAVAQWEEMKAAHSGATLAFAAETPEGAPDCAFPECEETGTESIPGMDGEPVPYCAEHAALVLEDGVVSEDEVELTASGAPAAPPAEWFSDPGLTEPTPLVVTEEGRVWGHIALWGTCHTSHAHRECVMPPHSASQYAYFRTGAVITSEGQEVAVGHLTLGTGHAGERLNAAATLAHYDNTGTVAALVSAGEDAHGIWVAGALPADLPEEKRRALRAAPISGDWRRIGSGLELVAALAVNVPGFPVPRTRGLVAAGQVQSLVASGVLERQDPSLSADDHAYLRRLAARERAAQVLQIKARAVTLRARTLRQRGAVK